MLALARRPFAANAAAGWCGYFRGKGSERGAGFVDRKRG